MFCCAQAVLRDISMISAVAAIFFMLSCFFDFIYAKLGYLQSLLHKNSSKSSIIVQIETLVFKIQLYGRR